ncbi:restriction endonuclease [Desulfovibrio desulfuricans]|uniref:restriction endonuclease n=1 Tax=Desulfovibrio desulfuricans TaxID=876 RepID=UPI001AE655FC|nr:restriction endonuclease [Desulfovibrio desulfuricans]MDD3682642.1 restriction endonuclease [Desulfovibrio desulfuricans]QTO40600.1 restriction endonuclease [Desulfovibrio desulfuricans]
MAIPDFQSFMLPVLLLAANGPLRTAKAIAQVSDAFGLSAEDRQEMLASGRQTRVANRVYWAFVHLTKAGLLQREARGVYGITAEGQQALQEAPQRIDINFLIARAENYRQFRSASNTPETDNEAGGQHAPSTSEEETPEERVEAAFAELNGALRSDLQERLQAMHNADFERLIVKLMLGLGYGAGGLGKRTGGTGDGAIDGIITEDVLGLDVIYLQAKRYSQDSAIGPDKIREFAGAMDAHGITKGVFVTTSRYTKAAREYAERSHKRLRLIDGHELAGLMVQHDIGVRRYRSLELKKLDVDFFEELGE